MPTFAVFHQDYFMKIVPGIGVTWVKANANTYSSKYAAKRHLKQLDNVPDNVKIVEVETVMENI